VIKVSRSRSSELSYQACSRATRILRRFHRDGARCALPITTTAARKNGHENDRQDL